MGDGLNPLLLALLELVFVTVSLLLLHSLRNSIGRGPFYLLLGLFLVFGHFLNTAGLVVESGSEFLVVNVGSYVLLTPFMVALLIVYIVDGTLEAQRLILGLLVVLGAFYYLASVISHHCTSGVFTNAAPDVLTYFGGLVADARQMAKASFLAHSVDFFALPVLYQFFRNRRVPLFLSLLFTFLLAQTLDGLVYHLVVYPDREQWFYFVRGTYLPRVAAMGVTAGLTTIYLRMCNLPQGESRRPLDIIVAFVGGYGRAKRLQRDIHEWEGRYRVVVENSNDLIFILNRNGQVLNANEAALRKLGFDAGRMTGFFLPGILESGGKLRCNWSALWQELEEAATDESDIHVVRREWELRSVTGGRIFLDASVSRAELHEQPVAVVIGRDMTERHRLDRRERHLQQRMSQIQRLEAVGSLAGGVAHDFNNILHTIQANLDRVGGNQSGLSETQQEVIENIRTATTRASSLTNQLLGYARQGRYELALLDVSDVVERVRIMFDPVARGRLDFRVLVAPDAMIVNADSTQLEQVFLNMLLNARDAVAKKREPRIVFRAEPVAEHTPGWAVRPDPQLLPEQYVCLRVKDNGSGISERIRTRIFEPFFTTKEMGKGTGMGLAMAYGCILNHQGWIHVESQVGRGTEFIVFLPRA